MMWLLLILGCRETLGPAEPPSVRNPERAWEKLLSRAVDDDGNVDYRVIVKDRRSLDGYVAWASRPNVIKGRGGAAAHAFWINAFNALTIYQVVERDLRTSVNEVPSLLPWTGSGFWFGTGFVVNGQRLSLWELGHERITHAQQDYRDLSTLVVAARSGPPARRQLYSPEELGAQLDDQMSRFMMSDRGMRFDGDRPMFNALFDRYGYELGLYTHGTDLCTLASYHTSGRRQRRLLKAAARGCDHGFDPFDWSLNQKGGR